METLINELEQGFSTKYRYWTEDKYGRKMFDVDDWRLSKLHEYFQENNIRSSLFKTDNGQLVMIISNYKRDDLEGVELYMKKFKDAYRFYTNYKGEWKTSGSD